MLYYATYEFDIVTIKSRRTDALVVNRYIIAFGTSYAGVKTSAETYARQYHFTIVDEVSSLAYSPS